jgi:phosphocarrier protein
MSQVTKDVTLINKLGLHARASAKFVGVASRFAATIMVERNGLEVNGKSIMGVMMLAAGPGSTIVIKADGDDAEEALAALVALVTDRFEEEQ